MPLASPLDAFQRTHFASPHHPRTAASPQTRSLLLRFVDAIAASNQRRAEREIARFFARNGDRLTDEMERAVAIRFGTRT